MTGIKNVEIVQAIVHKVGNPTRGEDLKLSSNSLSLNDTDVRDVLAHYFLHPFNEHEQYHFTHISNVAIVNIEKIAVALNVTVQEFFKCIHFENTTTDKN